MTVYPLIYGLVFIAAALGVMCFRRWTGRKFVVDHPNERSSHDTPTPSGGGVVIATCVLIALNLLSYLTAETLLIEFTIGSLLIVAVSFLDDVLTVNPIIRIVVHAIAAVLVIYAWGGYLRIELPALGVFNLGTAGLVLSFFWIVWLINAYNFMDGIDGIAALQAAVSGFGLALVGYFFSLNDVVFAGTVVSAAAAGFLVHNWHPAKIFMGDVGSAFLGYCFAALPLSILGRTDVFDARIPIIAVTLVWLFVFDAVLTLGYRLAKKEKVWEPHRKHIYQRLVIAGLPHHIVSAIYGIGSILSVVSVVLALNYRSYFLRIISISMALNTVALVLMWVFRHALASHWTSATLKRDAEM